MSHRSFASRNLAGRLGLRDLVGGLRGLGFACFVGIVGIAGFTGFAEFAGIPVRGLVEKLGHARSLGRGLHVMKHCAYTVFKLIFHKHNHTPWLLVA